MPSLEDWNWHILMLGQALLGVISDNFKSVTLRSCDDHWLVEVILFRNDEEDEEEIYDAVDEFSIFIEGIKDDISPAAHKKIIGKIIIQKDSIDNYTKDGDRLIFERRKQ